MSWHKLMTRTPLDVLYDGLEDNDTVWFNNASLTMMVSHFNDGIQEPHLDIKVTYGKEAVSTVLECTVTESDIDENDAVRSLLTSRAFARYMIEEVDE